MLDERKITIEELDSCLENYKYLEEAKKFLTEAIEGGAEVYYNRSKGFNIVARVPEMGYIRADRSIVIGIYMSIYSPYYSNEDKVYAWIAVEDCFGIRHGFNAGEYSFTDGYKTVLGKAVIKSGTCDFCQANVGLKKLIPVGFDNKACKKCYRDAKKELEYPRLD